MLSTNTGEIVLPRWKSRWYLALGDLVNWLHSLNCVRLFADAFGNTGLDLVVSVEISKFLRCGLAGILYKPTLNFCFSVLVF
jgi:hypothetical protein